MHNKDKVIFDKKFPYEYNICLYILEELCDKGVIDVFEMIEAIILLRYKYKMPILHILDASICVKPLWIRISFNVISISYIKSAKLALSIYFKKII